MENSETVENIKKPSSWGLVSVIIIVIIALSVWLYTSESTPPQKVEVEEEIVEVVIEEAPLPEVVVPEIITPEVEEVVELEPIIEPVEVNPLPPLNESDVWVREQLPSLTWRKELLKLVIDDDMIRRLVVFTDNFAQGTLAYKYSPLVSPNVGFSAKDKQIDESNQAHWTWDAQSEKRFTSYIELLRSMDSDKLVDWYIEIKPLLNEAYAELGYPEDDFTETVQAGIARVLDAEMPKEELKIVRPSVMYKYEDEEIEALDDVDKLLLRLGKENVLVIKSILLEFSEKLDEKSE